VSFDGTASKDPDGSIASYAWTFGDGAKGTGATPSHTYAATGEYTVGLTVTDSAGVTSATATKTLKVAGASPEEEAEKHKQEEEAAKKRKEEEEAAAAATRKREEEQRALKTVPVVALGSATPLTAPQPGSPVAPIPNVRLASTALFAKASGVVLIKVSCPAGEVSCKGTITLRTLSAVRAGVASAAKRKAILTLGTASFSVGGGRTVAVSLHLSSRARKLLTRVHVLRASVTIIARDTTDATHTTKSTVTLRAHNG
jgi:PKD repeat protein